MAAFRLLAVIVLVAATATDAIPLEVKDVNQEQEDVDHGQSDFMDRAVQAHNGTHTSQHKAHNGTHTAEHSTTQHVTYQPPAVGFHVILTPDFLTIAHDETVVFDHILVNIGHAYDVTHGHFTATVSGLYSFNANIQFRSSNNAQMNIAIVKNGDDIGLLYQYGMGTSIRTVVVFLDVGDIVWLKNKVDNNPRIYGGGISTFSGFLIAPVH